MTITPTPEQERWGAAVAIASMDVALPFLADMGLTPPNPVRLRDALRAAIVENRRAFEASPDRFPDLKTRVGRHVTEGLGPDVAAAFSRWVERCFVHCPSDWDGLAAWRDLIDLSVRRDDRWSKLGLPSRLAGPARQRRLNDLDLSPLHAIADAAETRPLSPWDLEVHALNALGSLGRDPYEDWVVATVRKCRFTRWFCELIADLSESERERFQDSAESLRRRIPAIGWRGPLPSSASFCGIAARASRC
jgi:hypothetical protein